MTRTPNKRRGTVLPILAVCLVGLMGFVALAIDIGMLAVARSQCQNAADIAALAGARTLDGKSANNNVPAAQAMAVQAATSNSILNNAITSAQVTTNQAGIYRYDATAGRFNAVFGQSPAANEAYGVIQVTLTTQQPTYFANIFGVQSLAVGASATAVHRPRDISVVLDFSGSMGYCSQFNYTNGTTQSLNPDSRFPTFGPWSVYGGSGMVLDYTNPGSTPGNLNTYVPPTPMQRIWSFQDSTGYLYAPNNLTMDTNGGPAVVTQFVQSDDSTSAFVSSSGSFPSFTNVNVSTSGNPTGIVTPAPASFSNQNATGFVGDKFPLRKNVTVAGTTAPTPDQYAHTVQEYLTGSNAGVTNTTRNATFETNGYDWDFTANALKPATARFQGFTMGPGYFGKTFYMWPPDPRAPANNIGDAGYVAGDWRRRFFKPRSGSAQDTRDNSMFWNTSGRWLTQNTGATANYIVNYDAILKWLSLGPQVLPTSLRCGRVVYYDTMPTTIPIDQLTGMCTSGATNDQRFWKDYIDYVLGAGRYTDSNVLFGANSANSNTGGGSTLYYNNPASSSLTPQITSRATLLLANGGVAANTPYMNYGDNPVHPRAQFWFGASSMLGYLQAPGNWLPGNCYEAQCWQLKAGVNAAVSDIQNNHPNDLAAVIFYSGSNGYNTARVSMSKNYTNMQNCLFYPYSVLSTLGNATSTFTPFSTSSPSTGNPAGLNDVSDTVIPNAGTYTCPQMGFEVAYNEFSSASGFNGRRTASKVVIFETDGIPNTICAGTLQNAGANFSYYSGIGGASYVTTSTSLHVTPKDNARAVVKQIVALTSANPPGYSTTRNPARVHCIAFGDLFESYSTSPMKAAALRFVCAVQIDGNTSPTPSGSWDNDTLDYNTYYLTPEPYKLIVGDYTTRISNLQQAMQRIMQGGVQIALIQ
jgi:Flp pilus assembly protein TadG